MTNRSSGQPPPRRRAGTCVDPCPWSRSIAGMILALDVSFQLRPVEVHLAQVARAVSRRLIAEMRRRWIAALPAGGDGSRAHAIAEFDRGDEAVARRAVHLLRALVGPR